MMKKAGSSYMLVISTVSNRLHIHHKVWIISRLNQLCSDIFLFICLQLFLQSHTKCEDSQLCLWVSPWLPAQVHCPCVNMVSILWSLVLCTFTQINPQRRSEAKANQVLFEIDPWYMILSQILFGLHQEKFQEVCINFEAKQNRRYCEGSRVSSNAEGGKVMHSCSRLKWQS